VAIEEQFYLVWPLLLAFLPKRAFPWLCLMLIAVSFYYNATSEHIHRKFHTLMALNYLSWGGLLAYLKYTYPHILNRVWEYKLGLWVFFGISILVLYSYKLLFHQMGINYYSYRPFISLYLALLYVAIIAYASQKSSEAYPGLSYLGRISYGLYLWHMFFIVAIAYLLRDLDWNIWISFSVKTILALVCSIVCASLSYMFFEMPFLNWKKRQ
jgi:peptidoglycan/LPS O-acetylase OafA/YrhL